MWLWCRLLGYWWSRKPIFVFDSDSGHSYWYGRVHRVGFDHLVLEIADRTDYKSSSFVTLPLSKVWSFAEEYGPGERWVATALFESEVTGIPAGEKT